MNKKIINKYLNQKEYNISSAEIYIEYLTNLRGSFSGKEISENRSLYNTNLNRAYYITFLESLGISADNEDYIKINSINKIDSMKELSPIEYQNNPYYKNIKFATKKIGKWKMTNLSYLPYEGFTYDELKISESQYFNEITPFGFFRNKFDYPCVLEGDTVWMSVTPHEINTMKDSILKAEGNVLVVGLGMGYYAYMISLKPEVKKIRIIEYDNNAIQLFKKYILPQFKYPQKIEIIQADAYRYLDETNLSEFNYSFVDIWHNVGDGEELYFLFKSRECDHPTIKFDYWIETSILAMVRRQLLQLIEETINGQDESIYQNSYDFNDYVINEMHRNLKDLKIVSENDLIKILKEDYLKQLIKKIGYLERIKF